MTFDLVDQPWIPVLRTDGPGTVSLREALLEASGVTALVPPFPGQVPALLRQVLLPVVLDALGLPRSLSEWGSLLRQGAFTVEQREKISSYLDEWRHRFDLFDEKQPFAQVGGLRTAKGDTKPSLLLVSSAASGNNVPLFSVRTEADELPLTPGEAALWLLHAHCWDTAGIKTGVVGDDQAKAGKTTGNPTGPLGQLGVIVPMGPTLFDTIVLNLPIHEDGLEPEDKPQWRRDPATPAWEERHARGLLDLLTWQSRRIRLFPETDANGETRVTRVLVAAGDRLAVTPEWEPHTAWRVEQNPKKGQQPRRPLRHVPGKAVWRGLDALLALSRSAEDRRVITSDLLRQLGDARVMGWLADDYPLQVAIYGIQYGNQSAVVEEAITDSLPLPVAALARDESVRDVLLNVATQAERLAEAINHLSADLRRAVGGEPLPRDSGQRPGDLLIHDLDPLVRRLFAGLQKAGGDEELLERGMKAWEVAAWGAAERIADHLLDSVPPDAFGGRETDNSEQKNNGGRENKKRAYRAATAEQNFRRQLRTILPLADEARRSSRK